MPTRRPDLSTTGRRLTLLLRSAKAAVSILSDAFITFRGRLITLFSFTFAASLPCAITLCTMSRSVMMPFALPFCVTMIEPTFVFRRSRAASETVLSAGRVNTPTVMHCPTLTSIFMVTHPDVQFAVKLFKVKLPNFCCWFHGIQKPVIWSAHTVRYGEHGKVFRHQCHGAAVLAHSHAGDWDSIHPGCILLAEDVAAVRRSLAAHGARLRNGWSVPVGLPHNSCCRGPRKTAH